MKGSSGETLTCVVSTGQLSSPCIYIAHFLLRYSNAIYINYKQEIRHQHIQAQSISDLTQHIMNEMRPDHNTWNYMPTLCDKCVVRSFMSHRVV